MQFRQILMTGIVVFVSLSCSVFSRNTKESRTTDASTTNGRTKDTAKSASGDSGSVALKAYKDVIPGNSLTSQGLFTVHKVKERYFFEIPNTIIGKDLLLVSRITQGAAGGKELLGYAGDEIGEGQIQFSKGPLNKLFIRLINYDNRSVDSSDNGMYHTVQASSLQPIQAAFDIKAIRSDSLACIIDVTDFLNSDNFLLYFDGEGKSRLGIGGYQKDRSYITEIKAYPLNVEVQTVNTYLHKQISKSYGLNVSFVLLPEKSMQPRYFDNRVGYFKRRYLDYDAPQGVKATEMITRWRVEPKDEDKERYLRGDLVEPKKPIVFYIDPATPKKWVPYLIQAVNDWQKAFEKAGFKNAIYALEAPINDTAFSLYDARHSAIIYKASAISNASGPNIHDPRTGEILESHINWYHNILSLVHDMYMVQAGPNDCGARKMVFDDSLMGQLIRFVCSHEVGHTLGLRHNMGASSTVPVDSLRSKTYLDKNGFCPSIMDYARFNYVAQPQDGLSREELMPRIGVYDEWAIEWGYRWLPQLKTREQEEVYMNQWIIASLKKDKRLWWTEYEPSMLTEVSDPRVQIEDLGDDNMKANYYGILNLKRVMSHLVDWAVELNSDYSGLKKMYDKVVAQYNSYVMHVANNIGNKYDTQKKAGQAGPVIQFIPIDVQRRAMTFLTQELFDTPEWLYNKEIFSLIGGDGAYTPFAAQRAVVAWLVNPTNYYTMSYAEMQQPEDAYSFDNLLTDLDATIWKELNNTKSISFARRNLQKYYVERLIQQGAPAKYESDRLWIDYYPILQKHMQGIVKKIERALSLYKDEDSRWHLINVKDRLVQALNSTRFPQGGVNVSTTKPAENAFEDSWNEKLNDFVKPNIGDTVKERIYYYCWYPFALDLSNPKK